MDGPDKVIAQAVGLTGGDPVVGKTIGEPVVPVDPSRVGAKPEHSLAVLENRPDPVAAQAARVGWFILVADEPFTAAVKAV